MEIMLAKSSSTYLAVPRGYLAYEERGKQVCKRNGKNERNNKLQPLIPSKHFDISPPPYTGDAQNIWMRFYFSLKNIPN